VSSAPAVAATASQSLRADLRSGETRRRRTALAPASAVPPGEGRKRRRARQTGHAPR
jgi:hypothetical protein